MSSEMCSKSFRTFEKRAPDAIYHLNTIWPPCGPHYQATCRSEVMRGEYTPRPFKKHVQCHLLQHLLNLRAHYAYFKNARGLIESKTGTALCTCPREYLSLLSFVSVSGFLILITFSTRNLQPAAYKIYLPVEGEEKGHLTSCNP